MAPQRMFGVDVYMIEPKTPPTPPTLAEFQQPAELFKWFQERPSLDTKILIRILCVRIDPPGGTFEPRLPADIINHAIWKPEVYHSLTSNPAGGAAGMIDEPWRFMLQTPQDGGPFASIAMSRHHHLIKGIFFYDDDMFNPLEMSGGEASLSISRGSGIQITTLPHQLLQTHSTHISRLLARLISRVKEVEEVLGDPERHPTSFGSTTRILHEVNTELIFVERRSRFEQTVCDAIEHIVKTSKYASNGTWPALAPQKTAVESRSFDLESLPRRIENARGTINDLIQQRNAQVNLEVMQSSFQIAEATLSDSRSMRTIAILTLVVLPAMAVASIFSMNMFNWSAEEGSQIGSKWLWIYFVITIPLTIATMAGFWMWNRQAAAAHALSLRTVDTDIESTFGSVEGTPGGTVESENIETVTNHPK